jgi:VWFA-related protein
MKLRIVLLAGGLLCLALTGVTATPQEGSAGQTPVFGEVIDVRLVNLEIVVTDKEGNRVPQLSPEDFRLLIDEEEVPIEFFTEVRNGIAMAEEGVPEGLEFMPGTTAGEAVGTSYLIFIDDFFSMARDRNIVLDEFSAAVTAMGPKDRAAIVAFDGRDLEMLTSWTTSSEELQGVLAEARERPSRGLQRVAERNRFDDIGRVETASEFLRADDRQISLETYLSPEERFYAGMLASQVDRAVQAAAASLRSFAEPPGRKVMLLAVGSWPFLPTDFVVSDARRPVYDTRVEQGGELFRPLTETANRLGYTLYPIDVPGFDRGNSDIAAAVEVPVPGGRSRDSGITDSRSNLGRNADFVREQEAHYTLKFLAEETGGQALINSQRRLAFQTAREDTRSYYWLGFTPQWQGDDSYHDVRVELRDPSLRARSRAGFLDLSRQQETTMVVESALLFGTPPMDDEPLRLTFGRPSKTGFRKMEVPLKIEIPLDNIVFLPVGSGLTQARLEVRVAVLDKSGNQADIPVIPLVIDAKGAEPAGQIYYYSLTLKMRRENHRTVVSVYDQASGSMLSGTAEVSP